MTAIIHGFIIAGFIILAAVYIRLGFILDELKIINNEESSKGRSCSTCIHEDLPAYEEPCRSCVGLGYRGLPNWEGK